MTPRTTPTDHRARLAARRRRTNRIRRGVAAGALTLFVGVWSGLYTQLAGAGSSSSTTGTTASSVVAKASARTASTPVQTTSPAQTTSS